MNEPLQEYITALCVWLHFISNYLSCFLLPSHTCPSKTYLTEEEFNKVFEMSVQEFRALPKWKQGNLKKKVDLF